MPTATEVIERYLPETRCQLLEIAATLDRHDVASARSAGKGEKLDPRWEKILRALELLADRTATPDRTERLLRLFSDPVD